MGERGSFQGAKEWVKVRKCRVGVDCRPAEWGREVGLSCWPGVKTSRNPRRWIGRRNPKKLLG